MSSGLILTFLFYALLLLFLVAGIFMRNQVRALRKISAAAEAFGMGRTVGPMKPEGAAEVRQAATAFNRMEDRIRRFVDSRTEMLAGISHDLRTPLTRLRLGLAMLPEVAREDAAAMTEDVEEMDRLIGAYLAFARGEGVEQPEETDLAMLLRDVVLRQSRGGVAIPYEGPDALLMELRAGAMRRCFGNLLDNARKHAKRVTVTLTQQPRGQNGIWADITIDDDGPGIPEAAREDAFKPFTSFTHGGTGLGLAFPCRSRRLEHDVFGGRLHEPVPIDVNRPRVVGAAFGLEPIPVDRVCVGIEIAKEAVRQCDLPSVVLHTRPALDGFRALDDDLRARRGRVNDALGVGGSSAWRIDLLAVGALVDGDRVARLGLVRSGLDCFQRTARGPIVRVIARRRDMDFCSLAGHVGAGGANDRCNVCSVLWFFAI